MRRLAATVLASALYGFSLGLVHSLEYGARNLVKFPLLVLVTAAVCSLAYWVFALTAASGLDFATVQRLSLRTYHDMAVLLAALSPVSFFLALTVERPVSYHQRGEYPLFLLLNVLFIAIAGSLALVRQAVGLVRGQGLSPLRGAVVVLCWLAVSLVAGGQCAWYFRPYFGLSFEQDVPFMLGTAPDYRGARSFFEAVGHLICP